jgi:hypothetical protein
MPSPPPSPRNGGARPGAGRPRLYAEPTVAFSVRIPASWAALIRERGLAPEVRRAIARLVKRQK